MKALKMPLRGIIPPTVTPFDENEEIDEQAFRDEIRFLFSAGVHGISIGGSMSEGYTFTEDELYKLITIAVEEVQGRIPVIAGIIQDCTRNALKHAYAAKKAGASYLMIAPIHYFIPNEEAIFAYYEEISNKVDLPILIYNVVPSAIISPELLQRLVTIDNVVGIKQPYDMHKLSDMIALLPEDFAIFSAVDDLLYPSFMLGVAGSISGSNTVLPEMCVELWNACLQGDHKRAREIHFKIRPVFHAMEGTNLPARAKEILRQLGLKVGIPRSPLYPITEEDKAQIAIALASSK